MNDRHAKIMDITVRAAIQEDTPLLRQLIDASVRGLQAAYYTPRQIELALQSVYGVDSQLIADGTYFAAEVVADPAAYCAKHLIVGCGGWSRHRTLFGGDQWSAREDDLLDPARDAAKIRAFFVHPDWARRGIGTMILHACEAAAKAAGFQRLEMGATLSGVPFYRTNGYAAIENVEVRLEDEVFPIVRMSKSI